MGVIQPPLPLPLPSALISSQQQQPASESVPFRTDPDNPHKRQRVQHSLAMPSPARKAQLLEEYVAAAGGWEVLSKDLERPRFQLLLNACRPQFEDPTRVPEDSFYIALHQLFCVWSINPAQVNVIAGMPAPNITAEGFTVLSALIRNNMDMKPEHRIWFSQFPGPLQDLMQASKPYYLDVVQVGTFLSKIAAEWQGVTQKCYTRGYPLLVRELVSNLGILSPVLRHVVFTACRRNIGARDGASGEQMEEIFARDRMDYAALAARYHTAQPPSEEEVAQYTAKFKGQYRAVFTRIPPNSRLAEQAVAAHVPAQSSTFVQNSPRFAQVAALRGSSGSPNPALLAGFGRSPSVTGARGYDTPSPTSMQNLSMHSPPLASAVQPGQVQWATPVLRSNISPQTQPSQMNPHQPGAYYFFDQSSVPTPIQQQQVIAQQMRSQRPVGLPQTRANQQNHINQPQQMRQSQLQGQAIAQQQMLNQQPQQVAQLQWQLPQQGQQPPSSVGGMGNSHSQQQQQLQQPQTFQAHHHTIPSTWQGLQQQQVSAISSASPLRSSSAQGARANLRAQTRVNGGSNSNLPATVPHRRPPGPVVVNPVNNALHVKYQATPPLDRPLIPPHGYPYPPQPVNPDCTALHQAHVRSPRLVAAELLSEDSLEDHPSSRFYQMVKSFALEPIKLPTANAFFKVEFTIPEDTWHLIAKDQPSTERLLNREYKQGTLQYRLRCIQTRQETSRCKLPEWTILDTVWPDTIFTAMNDHTLELRRKNHHGKDLPVDITRLIHLNKSNVLTISMPKVQKYARPPWFFIAVEVIEILQHQQIMDMCLNHKRIPAEKTLDDIKKSLSGSTDDDDIAVIPGDLSIDLADPFTARIFETPVRGRNCLHRECFDLETFFLTRTSKPKRPGQPCMIDVWKCPLCGLDARPYSLQVDDFLVSVRAKLAGETDFKGLDVKTILISPDGSWRAKLEDKPLKRKANGLDEDEFSDDDDEGQDGWLPLTIKPAASPKPTQPIHGANNRARPRAQAPIEVIDLDD
jgi:hypothetical protein